MRGLIGGWQWQRKGVSIGVNNLMDRMKPPQIMRTGWTEYATGATQPRSIQGASTIDEAVVAAPPVATTASSSFLGLENF